MDRTSKLHDSEALLRGVLDSSLDGIAALRSVRDSEGAIVDFEWLLLNQQAKRLLGPPSEHFVGRRLLDTLPGNRTLGLFDKYVRVVETGEPVENVFHYDHDEIRAWHQNIAVKLGDGFMVTFRDITPAKEEEQVREALTAAQLGTFEYHLSSGEMTLSTGVETIYGLAHQEEPRDPLEVLEHIHPDDRDEARKTMQASNEGRVVEFRIIRADGTQRWVQVRGQVLSGADSKGERLLGVILDVTERKQTELRDGFLHGLDRALQQLEDPHEIMATSARLLGEHLGVDRCAYAEVEPDERQFVIAGDHVRGDMPHITGRLPLNAFGESALGRLEEGQPVIVNDVDKDEGVTEANRNTYLRTSIRAMISVPLLKEGRFVAWMAVHQRTPRDWLPEETELVHSVTNRCWEALERARVTNALRASEERWRLALEIETFGVIFFDAAGDITRANDAFLRMTGYTREDLEERRLRWDRLTPPEWMPASRRAIEQLQTTGSTIPYEKEYYRKDGSRWWGLFAAKGLSETEGVEFILDISERKRAEAERDALLKDLELERSRLMTVFQEAPAAIATLRGPEHVFEMANPLYQRLVGNRELIGKPVRKALPDVEGQGFYELLDEVYRSGEPHTGHGRRILLRNESAGPPQERFLDFVYQPLREADGSVSGIFVHAVDVTEHKRAAKALAKAHEEMERRVEERTADLTALNSELESFNYSVSHDLRAPLRGIDGFSHALLEEYGEALDETAHGYLQRVRAGAERMGRLIDDLLNLSRLSRATRKRQQVDLSALAKSTVDALRSEEPERRVEAAIQPDLTTVGDEGLLGVVLENLLGNAWKFTRRNDVARIEFGSRVVNGESTYFVRDNGAGFDMRYADKLFAPFQRLHSPSEFAGTGIGLAIVQRILRQHGGRIWAEADVGEGATFYFTLPQDPD